MSNINIQVKILNARKKSKDLNVLSFEKHKVTGCL